MNAWKDVRRNDKTRLRQIKFLHDHAKRVRRWKKHELLLSILGVLAAGILAIFIGAQW